MGLLDALFQPDSYGQGRGLLDLIRNNAQNQDMSSGLLSSQSYAHPVMQPAFPQQNQPSQLDSAQWPYGPNGVPSQNAQIPSVPQQPPPVMQAQPAVQSLGFGDRLGAGLQSFANSGGPLPAIANGISSLISGQRTDPTGVAQQQMQKAENLTAMALRQRNIDEPTIQAAINNPEMLKTLLTQVYGPQTVQSLGNGYVADKNGKITRAYEPEQKDNFVVVQTGEDGLGRKTFAKMNKATGEQTPINASEASSAGGGLGDMNKTGAEYLATLPKERAGIVQGMVDGTIQPPSSFAAAKPYWQGMLAAAKNVDPSFDANNWTSRHNMSNQIAASGNSSMGGILSNGKSSFKHLAEYTESAADLGNASHDFTGGSAMAAAQNYLGNKVFAGSDTSAKIKAINDNLGHYGQESTKFYAGTGGGVEERMNALKEMNPNTTSSEEMAAYAAKEKSLMLDRLREKESQIRDVMGEAYLQKHPVFTPELLKDIARIDANVLKLRGQPEQSSSPPGVDKSAIEAEMKRRGLLK